MRIKTEQGANGCLLSATLPSCCYELSTDGIRVLTIMIMIILPLTAVSGSDVMLKLRLLDLEAEVSAVLLFIVRSDSSLKVVVEQAK